MKKRLEPDERMAVTVPALLVFTSMGPFMVVTGVRAQFGDADNHHVAIPLSKRTGTVVGERVTIQRVAVEMVFTADDDDEPPPVVRRRRARGR